METGTESRTNDAPASWRLWLLLVVILAILAAFVLLWNRRLYAWFVNGGLSSPAAAVLVAGPFAVVAIVWFWKALVGNTRHR